jgi:hypothetical protein
LPLGIRLISQIRFECASTAVALRLASRRIEPLQQPESTYRGSCSNVAVDRDSSSNRRIGEPKSHAIIRSNFLPTIVTPTPINQLEPWARKKPAAAAKSGRLLELIASFLISSRLVASFATTPIVHCGLM